MKPILKNLIPVMIVLLSAFMLSFATSCKQEAPRSDPYKSGFLVDVRTPEEFAQGSVKGAVNIPLDEIESRLDEFKGKTDIVVFCRSGNRSRQASEILKRHGFDNVTDGGPWTVVAEKVAK
jgi:phage shock protein E